jgi:hypothetical protein
MRHVPLTSQLHLLQNLTPLPEINGCWLSNKQYIHTRMKAVLVMLTLKITIFWDMMPCSLVDIYFKMLVNTTRLYRITPQNQ